MLASITPLGERSRRQQWGVTVTTFLVGAAAGGTAIGASAASLGQLIELRGSERLIGFATATLLLAGVELTARRSLPTHDRQVDEQWLRRYRGWVYGIGFGAQLGSGLATSITTSAIYSMLAGLLLAPSIGAGCLIGLTFGATRGLLPLFTVRVRTPRQLAAFHGGFAALDRPAWAVALAAQLSIAASAVLIAG